MAVNIDLQALDAGTSECDRLVKSADAHLKRNEHHSAIQDFTRIIEIVTRLRPMFSAKGESMTVKLAEVYKKPYMNFLKFAYAGRATAYHVIGETAKCEADLAMCRKLGIDLPLPSTPKNDSVATLPKFFSPNTSAREYQELADKAIAADNYEEAVGYCDKVLEPEPNNWIAMLSKGLALGFLATPENSWGTLNDINPDSILSKSFTWFHKAQITYIENYFESKIPSNSSTTKKFCAHSELITLYVLMLAADPDACDLIRKQLPEVRCWLNTLNRA